MTGTRCTKLIQRQWNNYIPSDRITSFDQLLFLTSSLLNRVAVIDGKGHNPGHGDIKAICRERASFATGMKMTMPEFCVWLYDKFGASLTSMLESLPSSLSCD
jgi:hypothetical protein